MKHSSLGWLLPLSRVLGGVRRSERSIASREPDVPYQPSPPDVVRQMLRLAGVRRGDVVYDLGSGDGRIVIAAARLCGARGVGIDIDPVRIRTSLRSARRQGVLDRVTFRQEDLFDANISEATVVTLFLWPEVSSALRAKLRRDLNPGTRVVSYFWEIGDWVPQKETTVDGRPIYLWTMPPTEGRTRARLLADLERIERR